MKYQKMCYWVVYLAGLVTLGLSTLTYALPQDSLPAVIETIQHHADASYWVIDGKAKNSKLGWQLQFSSAGVKVETDLKNNATPFQLSLKSFGDNRHLSELPAVEPKFNGNMASYAQGPVEAWYVNGPLGLEQGFTVAKPISGPNMVLELAASWSAMNAGSGVEFVHAQSRWSYGELQAKDATGKILPSSMKIVNGKVRIEVATNNANFPVTIDPLLSPRPVKLVSNKKYDRFGNGVSLSGDGKTIFIGGYSNEVFIFQKNPNGWAFKQKLPKPASLHCAGSLFGVSIALSQDASTALVGASGQHIWYFWGIPYSADYSCREVSVYVKKTGNWVLEKLLTAPEVATKDFFGSSVSLSSNGKTALIGAEFTKCTGTSKTCGAAYIYERGISTWNKRGRFQGTSNYYGKVRGFYGSATTLSANGLWGLIGDRSADSTWILARINGNWKQIQKLTLTANTGFGSSVGLSTDGSRALVGAQYAGGTTYCKGSFKQCGAAFSFKRAGTVFSKEASITAGGNYYSFGESLALSANGTRAVIGASGADCAKGNCGAAYFYNWNGRNWLPQGRFTSPTAGLGGSELGGAYGQSLSSSSDGKSVAVAAEQDKCTSGNECGAVYLYSPIYP